MDNQFTQFIEVYADDLRAFVEAIMAFVESVIAMMTGNKAE